MAAGRALSGMMGARSVGLGALSTRIGVVLVIALFLASGLPMLTSPGLFSHPAPVRLPHPAAVPASSTAVATSSSHWGHPVDSASARVPAGLGGSMAPSGAVRPQVCSPWVNNTVVGEFGVSFTFNTTPANLSGPAPLNLSWNLTVYGGGLPPYQAWVWVYGSAWGNISTAFDGNITVPDPGLYNVEVYVSDSTCTQVSDLNLPVLAWGPLGPHPFVVSASSLTGTVPATINYTANTTLLPANWSILWTSPYLYSNQTWVDHTYYQPGAYNATACFVEPNQNLYACSTSPTVVVNGSSVLQVGSSVPAGNGPVNLTFYANITNTALVPNGTMMYLYAWNGTVGSWVYSNNSSITLTESVGCGAPWTQFVPLSGNCTWFADASLIGTTSTINGGFITHTRIYANVTSNASLSNYYPSATFSFGPSGGPAPVNLTLNFSMSGGLAPYWYTFNVFGRSSVFANGTYYPTVTGSGHPWNGSLTSFVVPLTAAGVYWGEVFLVDAADNFLTFDFPLVYVGNVTVYAPAPLHVTGSATVTSAAVGSTVVEYAASVDGGVPPFTVQWSFGDGTYGSSAIGSTVNHTYLQPGQYQPVVTITDARGHSVSQTLPSVTVVKSATPLPTGSYQATPGWGLGFLGAAVVIAAALCIATWFVVRRGDRREAEALVADLERSCVRPPEEPGR